MDEPAERKPRGYRSRAITEIALYAVSSIIVLYLLASGWLLYAAADGRVSDTVAVAGVIALGLAAPICPWALGIAMGLQAKQQTRVGDTGAISSAVGQLSRALRAQAERRGAALPTRGLWGAERDRDIALAIVSMALFWGFYAGSLFAAFIVPVTVHWARRRRDPKETT